MLTNAFNPQKCQVLHVTNKRKPITYNYNIHGLPLETADTAKYIGVHLKSNLNWSHHIKATTSKANAASAFLQ